MPILATKKYEILRDEKGKVTGYGFQINPFEPEEIKTPNIVLGPDKIKFLDDNVTIPISEIECKNLMEFFLNHKVKLTPSIEYNGE